MTKTEDVGGPTSASDWETAWGAAGALAGVRRSWLSYHETTYESGMAHAGAHGGVTERMAKHFAQGGAGASSGAAGGHGGAGATGGAASGRGAASGKGDAKAAGGARTLAHGSRFSRDPADFDAGIGARGRTPSPHAGAETAQDRASYASPYTPPEPDAGTYAQGPSTGAVGVKPEMVGPYARGAKRSEGRYHEGMPGQGGVGAPKRRRSRKPIVICVLVALVALAAGAAYLYVNPPLYTVTINGTQRTVKSGSTLKDVIDEGFASPKAGNLMAVDGSVATEGGGDPFEATVNGTQTADPSTAVPRGATVTIEDGKDTEEPSTEKTEAIAHGTSGGTDVNSTTAYWAGSIHVYSEGEDGEQTVKTGQVSGKTVTTVTKQPVDAGYHVYTTDTNGDKVIALTFDDGPWPTTTSEILDILKANDAKATFFEIGNQVAENADVVKRIHAEGHQIASHTYDHAAGSGRGVDLTRMSADEQVNEVDKGFQAIDDVLGTNVNRVLRAPGGNYHGSIIETLKDKITAEVGWNVDTEDWRRPGADKIAQAILSVKPGEVVLMHDGGGDRSQTVEALKTALPQLKAQGYKFVTVDELMSTYGMPKAK